MAELIEWTETSKILAVKLGADSLDAGIGRENPVAVIHNARDKNSQDIDR